MYLFNKTPNTKKIKMSISPLDQAILNGPTETIKYYEPLTAAMARTRATQERATLNEDDMKQLARMTILRCYNALSRMPAVRSFDGLVKDAIRKRLLSEVGKEFCVSRGRFLIGEFKEVITDENDKGMTPACAKQAYDDYNANIAASQQYERLIEQTEALLPPSYIPVFRLMLDQENGEAEKETAKQLGARLNISGTEYEFISQSIRLLILSYKEELFPTAQPSTYTGKWRNKKVGKKQKKTLVTGSVLPELAAVSKPETTSEYFAIAPPPSWSGPKWRSKMHELQNDEELFELQKEIENFRRELTSRKSRSYEAKSYAH